MTEVFLGIDPSLTATGIVALDGGEVVLEEVVGTEKQHEERVEDRFIRMDQIRMELFGLLPHEGKVALEQPAYTASHAFDACAATMGVRRSWLKLDLDFVGVLSPNTLKKYLTGSGSSSKRDMVLPTYKRFGYEAASDDLLDAYGLAHLCWAVHDFEAAAATVTDLDGNPGYIRKQLEVLVSERGDEWFEERGLSTEPWQDLKPGGKAWRRERVDVVAEYQEAVL